MKRVLKWIGGIVLGLVLLVVLAFTVVLWSPAVGRRIINLGLKHAPPGLTIGSISGPLRSPLLFTAIRYRTPSMDIAIDSVAVTWRLSHLLRKQLPLDRLHVTGMRVVMADSAPADTTAKSSARSKPHLPVDIELGDVLLRDISVKVRDSVSVQVDSARLSGHATAYRLALNGSANAPKVQRVGLVLHGSGSMEEMTLDSTVASLLRGSIGASGKIAWYPAIAWKLALRANNLQPAQLLADTMSAPGSISAIVATSGQMDSLGVVASVALDSLSGTMRKQALRGMARLKAQHAEYVIDTLDAGWGSVALVAAGKVGDALDVRYHLTAADLRTLLPTAGGSFDAKGTASGTKTAPHVKMIASGSRLRSGANRIARLSLNADVDVVKNGVIAVDMRADSAMLGTLAVPTLKLAAHGTRDRHHVALDGTSAKGILHLAVDGGYDGKRWQGRVAQLRLDSSVAGSWQLRHPAALVASAPLIRLDSLCVARVDSAVVADSATASVCVSGSKRETTWQAAVDALALPLQWLAAGRITTGDSVSGTVSAHARAAGAGSRVSGTVHVATGNAALSYTRPGAKKPEELRLDSAVVDASIGRDGLKGAVGMLLSNGGKVSLATLSGTVSAPAATSVDAMRHSPLTATLDAKAADLAFIQPFLSGVDSVRGALTAHVDASGTVRAPSVKGDIQLQKIVVGLPSQRSVAGAIDTRIDLMTKGTSGMGGTLAVTPHEVRYNYRDLGKMHWLAIDGAGIAVNASDPAADGSIDLKVSSDVQASVATITGKMSLPEYSGGQPVAKQQATATFSADISNLQALQPVVQSVDSLAGSMKFTLDMQGRVGTPTVTAKLALDSLRAHLPFGSTMRGGVQGDFKLAVSADSAIDAQMSITPVAMTFTYDEGGMQRVSLDSSSITASAGANGVQAKLELAFRDEQAPLAAIHGTLALPQYTRFGRPMKTQPVEATLTGKGDNFSFIRAFTPQVDSASGTFTLDSKASGTVADAKLFGALEMHHGHMRLPQAGITLDSLEMTARGDEAGGVTLQASMRSGGGNLAITGSTPLKPTAAAPGKIHIEGTNFTAANSAQFRAVMSPKIDVTIADEMRVQGDVTVPIARLQLAQAPATAVAASDDVILIDSVSTRKSALPIHADVRVTLGDSVTFSGFNFDAKMSGALRVIQEPEHMATASGAIVIDSGSYKAYGQDLTIQNGRVEFGGGPINDPALNIRAARTAEDSVVAGLEIKGTLKQPDVQIFSEPAMSQTEALSYILTGHAAGQGTGASGNLLSKALSAVGLKGGNALAGTLGHQLGLADAKIEASGDIKKASFLAGTYLSPNVYVSYGIGLFNPVSTLRLRYVVSSHFTLQTETGSATGGDVMVKTTSH